MLMELVSLSESTQAEVLNELENQRRHQSDVSNVERDLDDIERDICDEKSSKERDEGNDPEETVQYAQKYIAGLQVAKSQLEGKRMKFGKARENLPSLEEKRIEERIGKVENEINSRLKNWSQVRKAHEEHLKCKVETEVIDDELNDLEGQIVSHGELPIAIRFDALEQLSRQIKQLAVRLDTIPVDRSGEDESFKVKGRKNVLQKAASLKRRFAERVDEVNAMKNECKRFGKAFAEINNDLDEIESALEEELVNSVEEGNKMFVDRISDAEGKGEKIVALEEKLGEIGGRLQIVGDVISKEELYDCRKRIESYRDRCKECKEAVNETINELKESQMLLRNSHFYLENLTRKVDGYVMVECAGSDVESLRKNYELNAKMIAELEQLEKELTEKSSHLEPKANFAKETENLEKHKSIVLIELAKKIDDLKCRESLLSKKICSLERLQSSKIDLNDVRRILTEAPQKCDCENVQIMFEDCDRKLTGCKTLVSGVEGILVDLVKNEVDAEELLKTCRENIEEIDVVERQVGEMKQRYGQELEKMKELEDEVSKAKSAIDKIQQLESEETLDLGRGIESLSKGHKEAEASLDCLSKATKLAEEISFASLDHDAKRLTNILVEKKGEFETSLAKLELRVLSRKEMKEKLSDYKLNFVELEKCIEKLEVPIATDDHVDGLTECHNQAERALRITEDLLKDCEKLALKLGEFQNELPPEEFQDLVAQLQADELKISLKGVELRNSCLASLRNVECIRNLEVLHETMNKLQSDRPGIEDLGTGTLQAIVEKQRTIDMVEAEIADLDSRVSKEEWKIDAVGERLAELKQCLDVIATEENQDLANVCHVLKERLKKINENLQEHDKENLEQEEDDEEKLEKLKGRCLAVAELISATANLKDMASALSGVPFMVEFSNGLLEEVNLVSQRLTEMRELTNESFSNLSDVTTFIANYEEDLSKLSHELEELRKADEEEATVDSIEEIKRNLEEKEFVLQRIEEACDMVFEEEENFLTSLSEKRKIELLDFKKEFLEEFEFFKGKVEHDLERVKSLENIYLAIESNVEKLSKEVELIWIEVAKEEVDDPGERMAFLKEKLAMIEGIEERMQHIKKKYQESLSVLPEMEVNNLDEMLKCLDNDFIETATKVSGKIEMLKDCQNIIFEGEKKMEQVLEALQEVEVVIKEEGKASLETQLEQQNWIRTRLEVFEEDVNRIGDIDEIKSPCPSLRRYAQEKFAGQRELVGIKIMSFKEAAGKRAENLNSKRNLKGDWRSDVEKTEADLQEIENLIDEVKLERRPEAKLEVVRELNKRLANVKNQIRESQEKHGTKLSDNEREDIELDIHRLLQRVADAEISIAQHEDTLTDLGQWISAFAAKIDSLQEGINDHVVNVRNTPHESLENAKQHLDDLKDSVQNATKEYELLKVDLNSLEDQVEVKVEIDRSMLNLEMCIVEGEELVRTEKARLAKTEKAFSEWCEASGLLNENVPSGGDIRVSSFESLTDAAVSVADDLADVQRMQDEYKELKVRLDDVDLPSLEKEFAKATRRSISDKLESRQKQSIVKKQVLDVLQTELKDIEKHLMVNLKWIAIAKRAVKNENKGAKCTEDLVNERNDLVSQISSLDDDVQVAVSFGNSLCERLPRLEKEKLSILLNKISEDWDRVKCELVEKRTKLDESITERDEAIAALSSCLFRLENVEEKRLELEDLDEMEKDEFLLEIRHETKAVNDDMEEILEKSRLIAKRVTEEEKDLILDDLDKIEKKMLAMDKWLNEVEANRKARGEKDQQATMLFENLDVKIKECFQMLEEVEAVADQEKTARSKLMVVCKQSQLCIQMLENIAQKIEAEQLLHLKGRCKLEEAKLGEVTQRLDEDLIWVDELVKKTEEIYASLAELSTKVAVVEECIRSERIVGVKENLKTLLAEAYAAKEAITSSQTFKRDEKRLIILHSRIEERISKADESLEEMVFKDLEDYQQALKSLEERLEDYNAKFEEVRKRGSQLTDGNVQIFDVVESLQAIIAEVAILQSKISSEWPTMFTISSEVNIHAESKQNVSKRAQMEIDFSKLQESVFQFKAELELRVANLKEAFSRAATFDNDVSSIRKEIDTIENKLDSAASTFSLLDWQNNLILVGKQCLALEKRCICVLISLKNLPSEASSIIEKNLDTFNALHDRAKVLHFETQEHIEFVDVICRSLSLVKGEESIDEAKVKFETAWHDGKHAAETSTIGTLLKELTDKQSELRRSRTQLIDGMARIRDCHINISGGCQDMIDEGLRAVEALVDELDREIAVLLNSMKARDKESNMANADEIVVDEREQHFMNCDDETDGGASQKQHAWLSHSMLDEDSAKVEEIVFTVKMKEAKVEPIFIDDSFSDFPDVEPLQRLSNSWDDSNLGQNAILEKSQFPNSSFNHVNEHQLTKRMEIAPVAGLKEVKVEERLDIDEAQKKDDDEGKSNGLADSRTLFVEGPLSTKDEETKRSESGQGYDKKANENEIPDDAKKDDINESEYSCVSPSESSLINFETPRSSIPEQVVEACTHRKRSDQSIESGLDSLLPLDDVFEHQNALSASLSSLETGFEDEEEIYGLIREASAELIQVDQLLVSARSDDYESIESLQKALITLHVSGILLQFFSMPPLYIFIRKYSPFGFFVVELIRGSYSFVLRSSLVAGYTAVKMLFCARTKGYLLSIFSPLLLVHYPCLHA